MVKEIHQRLKKLLEYLGGGTVVLNQTDKKILERLANYNRELELADFNDIENPGLNLRKLQDAGYVQACKQTCQVPINSFGESGSQQYDVWVILPKGRHYIEKPPLSRGENINLKLSMLGIIVAIILGLLTLRCGTAN